jgi:hypothetical protein
MGDWLAGDFAIFCAPGQNWMLIVLAFSLALQLRVLTNSESIGNHDSKIVGACGVD